MMWPSRGAVAGLAILTAATVSVGFSGTRLQTRSLKLVEEARVEFGGGLGAMMALVPGARDPVTEVKYYKGNRLRVDAGSQSSTVTDLGAGHMLNIDHEAKRFTRIDLRAAAQAVARAVEDAGDTAHEAPEETPQGPGGDAELSVDFSVERTGEKGRFAGVDAERVLMTVAIEARGTPEGETEQMEAGTMVLFMDLWMSDRVPGYQAVDDFNRAMAEELGSYPEVQDASRGMQQAFAHDPRIQEAMERSQEEMAGMEGIPVKSVGHFILLPPGLEFDRARALAEADQPLGAGVRAAAGDAAGEAARDAAVGALRGLAGRRLGRRQQEPQPEPEPEAEVAQATVLRVVTELKSVDTGEIPDAVFEPPEGYTEAASPLPAGR